MTDSGVFAINASGIEITDFCGWNVSAQQVKNILESKYNTRKRYLAKKNFNSSVSNYYPQVELSQYANQPAELIVTFSVPKILFNTNLFEVTEQDFPKIVKQLQSKLLDMGISVSEKSIEEAKIYSLHVGKNIILEDGISCAAMLSAIKKMNFSKKLAQQSQFFDSTEKNIKNICEPGEQVSLWSSNQQICFYNKSSEISKNPLGKALIAGNQEYNNVLRFEYRMLKSKKVKDIFKKCGFSEDLTFGELFQDNRLNTINSYVWNHYVKPYIKNNSFLGKDPINIADQLVKQGISGTAILRILGAQWLTNAEDGFRTLKNLFPPRTGVIQNLLKDLAKVQITDNPIKDSLDKLENSILNYTPIRSSL